MTQKRLQIEYEVNHFNINYTGLKENKYFALLTKPIGCCRFESFET